MPNSFRDSPPTRACVRAVLSGLAGGALLADDACVAIASTRPRPRGELPGQLRLVVSIPPGGRQAFEVSYRLPASGTRKASAVVTGSEPDGSLERICQTTFLEP